ncbi:hypothetical protein [Colwellia sp. MEBiC06753]
MVANIHFVSYAAGAFQKNISANRFFAKLFLRPKSINFYCRGDLVKTPFYRDNRDVLDEPRGAGYWAWKPFYILECMKHVPDGDFVIYHDCGFGYRFKQFIYPKLLLTFADQFGAVPGIFIPEHGANKRWTKQIVFQQLGCNQGYFKNKPQIQATFSIWKNTAENRDFIESWLAACVDRSLVTDDVIAGVDNDLEFIEHRHDQSLLTLLALKAKLKVPNADDEVIPFNKSVSMVELFFRAKHSRWYAFFYSLLLRLGQWRKR